VKKSLSIGALGICLLLCLVIPAAEAANSLKVESRIGEPGQPDLAIPVRGEWEDSLLGYTISIEFDTDFLAVKDVSLSGTAAGSAEHFVPQWNNASGYLTAEVLMGTQYPEDAGQSIAPGSGILLKLVFDVKAGAPVADSTLVDLSDGLGIPTRQNRFFWNDGSVISPVLEDGQLKTIYVWECDFESDDGGFSGHGEWEWGVDPWDSGNHLWGTDLDGYYDPSSCYGLNASWAVPVGYDYAYLTFKHKYQFDVGKSHGDDGGNLQAMVPPLIPTTWDVVMPDWIPYDADSLFNNCLANQPGYSGRSQGWPGKVRAGFNLSDYQSPRVGLWTVYYDIRWMLGADQWANVSDGWFIDDVRFCAAPAEAGPFFIRGDVNNDGMVDITDVLYLSNYLYSAGPPPPPPCDRADVNDDGSVNVADVTYLINFIYSGGPPPPWPYPKSGIDSSPDNLPLECNGGKALGQEREISLVDTPLPRVFDLGQNSPNPFSQATELRYDLPQGCHVTLEIYNSLGQKVRSVVDAPQGAGHHVISWDADGLSSGIYFYRLRAGDFEETNKMLVVR
jgi:hypothetical protein